MFKPKEHFKWDPEKQWALPDRIFFGFGACHILAGVFLEKAEGWYGEWITPCEGLSGTHIYATNGLFTFDFHGYSMRERFLARYWRGQRNSQSGWDGVIERVDFSLLDTSELNRRQHRGPEQYLDNPIPRARKFIAAKKKPETMGCFDLQNRSH